MQSLEQYIKLVEAKQRLPLALEPLPYEVDQLEPVMSQDTLDYHYGQLAQGYVDRYNRGQGDATFNANGAALHNLFFPQLQPPQPKNKPHGLSRQVIEKQYGTFAQFKKAVTGQAMAIQGSGWVYMDPQGQLKTIPNHDLKSNMKIALLIDWWEHAWALDYQSDKSAYLNNIWQIINWAVINDRLQGQIK
jgi:Fe-Mn family superoxide dismutase